MPRSIREQLAEQMTALDNETKVQSYLDLPDTPSSYSEQTGKILVVNAGEDALEFTNNQTGDMEKATYDPTNVNGDAFSMGSMVETVTKKVLTDIERTQLGTNTTDIGTLQTADIQNVKITGNQTISGLKKFSTLPQQTIYSAPTTDVELSPKKYIDDNDALQMTKATYDPTAVTGDVFSMGNMAEATTEKIFTATERTKLSGIEALADVTDATNVLAAGAVMTSGNQTIAGTKAFDTTPQLSLYSAPIADVELAAKKYVDDQNDLDVQLAGAQTITGLKDFDILPQQSLYAAPTIDAELAPKKYVDDEVPNNIVDGNATGAIRSINAKSDYNMGDDAVSLGFTSKAEGYRSTVSGGEINRALSSGSVVSGGRQNEASDSFASILGGDANHASGANSSVLGGQSNTANGFTSVAQNRGSIANGSSQTAMGKYNVADTTSALIVGNGTSDVARSNALKLDFVGNLELAGTVDGRDIAVDGTKLDTIATDATKQLNILDGNGTGSIRGVSAKTSYTMGITAVALGFNTTASGDYSYAGGSNATATGSSSHAEGGYTVASGYASHAQNLATLASGSSQTSMGKFNIADTASALIVGNGTSDVARSNALKLDFVGNLILSGDTINLATQKTPASATATGIKGDIVHDANYIYVCTATNTWKRTAIATW